MLRLSLKRASLLLRDVETRGSSEPIRQAWVLSPARDQERANSEVWPGINATGTSRLQAAGVTVGETNRPDGFGTSQRG